MHFKTLPFLFLAATALAAPEAQPADSDSYQSYIDQLDSLATQTDIPTDFSMPTNMPSFKAPPPSIMSVIMTAVPASYLEGLSNPSSRSSMFSEISAGHYPDWYKSLPGDVKTYISTAYQTDAKATGAQKTGDSTVTSGPKATATGGSDSASKTSTSEAGAAPTGAIAAGLAGAAGILGLAIAL
ncbi:hypothetical protein ETB97_011536 [Aspergillus alliaceus]|uniref:Uncharacterized protein n=1 Tax=Petromyces alliaceus TaxID=209559 RepID=A0A5N6G1S5_PETAA|nr:uncharacterized protein BDW43DRAFT_268021 [Aspergillus alliaceus]KAB8236276.1 hypothetical protein BDW43DRAFT_268021 [Aspergillus alliaceus]KAE8384171.1 hypothetical protein BDV23DRAFT_167354 [Aspergillus alliaceus]KAF5862539.1 hypothetical protein ETB97_011536 [Aspergillus burnettii]